MNSKMMIIRTMIMGKDEDDNDDNSEKVRLMKMIMMTMVIMEMIIMKLAAIVMIETMIPTKKRIMKNTISANCTNTSKDKEMIQAVRPELPSPHAP